MEKNISARVITFYIIITIMWILISLLVFTVESFGVTSSRIAFLFAISLLYVCIALWYTYRGDISRVKGMIFITLVTFVLYLVYQIIVLLIYI